MEGHGLVSTFGAELIGLAGCGAILMVTLVVLVACAIMLTPNPTLGSRQMKLIPKYPLENANQRKRTVITALNR